MKYEMSFNIEPMKFALVYDPPLLILEYLKKQSLSNAFKTLYHKMPIGEALCPRCTAESILEYLEKNN